MVILVDEKDKPVGITPKLDAHRDGVLHRAVSVIIFNPQGQMLIQRRAMTKYHSPGLWANACCSHPRPGETTSGAAARRLNEELGICCDLTAMGSFLYKADVGGGLTEYEYDHIFTGISETDPAPDPCEIMDYEFTGISKLLASTRKQPDNYAVWFRLILTRFTDEILKWKEKKQRS